MAAHSEPAYLFSPAEAPCGATRSGLMPIPAAIMTTEKKILTEIISLGQDVAQVHDVDLLLEKILTNARTLAGADAGSIYVKSGNRLLFACAQNDTLQHTSPPGNKLPYASLSVPVDCRSIAGYVSVTGITVNIPDAYRLGSDAPYVFDRSYDRLTGYRSDSVLAFPLKTPRKEILGVLQLLNARDAAGRPVPFADDLEPYFMHFANTAAIALERAQMTRALILRTIRMAEMRDPNETGSHVNRVGAYAAEIYEAWAVRCGIDSQTRAGSRDILRIAAMLHDVGKVAISDIILKKPSRLDYDEYEVMKQHTFMGARLFADPRSDFDEAAFHIALEHHERWDGNGYPGYVTFEENIIIEKNRKKQVLLCPNLKAPWIR